MATNFQTLASSVERHLGGGSAPKDRGRSARWERAARHDALMASTLAFRILRERAMVLKPAADRQRERRGLANLVSRFNIDMMAHGPWVRLGSSDPRDYIYALRGLVSDGDPVSGALVTDYNKKPGEIFADFTRLLFNPAIGTPAIDTLLLSQTETKEIDGLPS